MKGLLSNKNREYFPALDTDLAKAWPGSKMCGMISSLAKEPVFARKRVLFIFLPASGRRGQGGRPE